MRAAGKAPERMAYGIDKIEAHAIPTPTIESTSNHGLLIKYTESRPIAPQIRQSACTVFLLVAAASFGNRKATTKHVMFINDIAKPPHSTPCVYASDFGSNAPKTCRAT